MTPERWEQVKALFVTAIALPPDRRDAHVRQAAAGDEDLCAEVLSLLAADLAAAGAPAGGATPLGTIPGLEPGVLPAAADVDGSTDSTHEAGADASGPALTEWGHFKLLEAMGEGGFGRVYRAWDPDLQRQVAVKILHRRVDDSRQKERLLREGRALAKVRDPHVVDVLSIESHRDQIALCMEFIAGETLEQALASQGPMNAREAALVGEDVCQALAAVHAAGYVHRDVKTRNVMREQGGRIVLMDFGTGRDTTRAGGATHDLVGTPIYMAPEVLRGERATPASDVYSVGVMLFRLVTHQYPVAGYTMEELREAHGQGRRQRVGERRPDLPLPFAQVVERALEPDPRQRFASAVALREALAAATSVRRVRALIWIAAGLGMGLLTIALLGFLMTVVYNQAIGRVGRFAQESPLAWLQFGFSSFLTPLLYIAAMLLTLVALKFAIRILRLLPPLHGMLNAGAARFAAMRQKLNLDDPEVLSQAIASLGILGLAVILWRFSPVLLACAAQIADAPAEVLLPLRRDEERIDPSLFRASLDALILFFGVALVRIRRLCVLHPKNRRSAVLPVTILLGLSVLLLELPYRVIWNRVERVDVAGQACFLLGEDSGDGLIYCPARVPPRNEVIRLDRPDVKRLGTRDNFFTPVDAPR